MIKYAFLHAGLFLYLIFNTKIVFGQDVSIRTEVDKKEIFIGEPIVLSLQVKIARGENVYFSFYRNNQVLDAFEVIEASKVDTLIFDKTLELKQQIILTSFDSGTHILPPFQVIHHHGENTDTVSSQPPAIKVNTVPLDLSEDIRDIKPPLAAPFNWGELLNYIYFILLGVLLIGGGVYTWIYFRKAKQDPVIPERQEIAEPPHVIALRALNALKQEDLPGKKRVRDFHIKLTDHIRHYIQARFNIPAMEETSEEILQNIRGIGSDQISYEALEQILLLADQVKFAKAIPSAKENDDSIHNAFKFVDRTKEAVEVQGNYNKQ